MKYKVIMTVGKPGEMPIIVKNVETGVETKYYLYIQPPYPSEGEHCRGIDEHGAYLTDLEIIQAIDDYFLAMQGLKRM
jgi:hypothetical protein